MAGSRIETIRRQDRARALHLEGKTWAQVAGELGYASESGAYEAALASARRDPVRDRQERIAIEDARLEWMLGELQTIYERKHYVVEGKDAEIICDPVTGVPLDDDKPKMEALRLILAVSQQRRQLYGLDAPRRKIVETFTSDALEAEIRRLESNLGLEPGEKVIAVEARKGPRDQRTTTQGGTP